MNMFASDAPTVFAPPMTTPTQMPKPKRKGGIFGGVSIDPSAFLAAFAAGMGSPAGMHALRSIHERRMAGQQRQMEEQQYQQRRGDSMEDWIAQQTWKAQHPEGRAPYRFESNSGDVYELGPDGQPRLVFKDPFRFKMVPNGMGGVVPVDIETLMGGQAPQGPVGKLTPIDEGGPTLGGSGGFL